MSKLVRILFIVLAVLIFTVAAGLVFMRSVYPKVRAAPDLAIESTPEKLARGEYLFNNVTLCLDCHSDKDPDSYAGTIIAGTEGKGGNKIHATPGDVYASNITPAALSGWTDGELLRAITAGVDKEGEPLVPMMPYLDYCTLSMQDARAVVLYLKTLSPIDNEVPETSIKFPVNLIFRTLPKDYQPQPQPDTADVVAYGKYLSKIAGCNFCHTPVKKGEPDYTRAFSGNHDFLMPGYGIVRSSNITPDIDTGIGTWTKKTFIARFKMYGDSLGQQLRAAEFGYQSPMPWTLLAGMKDKDLGAIYEYLHSLDPASQQVEKFTPNE